MSLGEKFNNNEKKSYPTVYSNYKMSNSEANEPTQLSFAFTFNGLLKIIIAPKKGMTEDGYVSYDHENEAFAHISYTKAKILVKEIDRLLNNEAESIAVDTKHGLLMINNNNGIYSLIIADIDPNTGLIMTSYSYEFKSSSKAINNYNINNGDFSTYEYPYLELEMIKDLLEQYYLSTSNAVAYSVINANRFNEERNKNSLEAIKKQLNIPTSGQYSNKPAGGQYFSKPHTPSNQTNIDDLESKLSSLDD